MNCGPGGKPELHERLPNTRETESRSRSERSVAGDFSGKDRNHHRRDTARMAARILLPVLLVLCLGAVATGLYERVCGTDPDFTTGKATTTTTGETAQQLLNTTGVTTGIESRDDTEEILELFSSDAQPRKQDNEIPQQIPPDPSKRAARWLIMMRNAAYGWADTPNAILALQLANDTWFNKQDLSSQLSVKQMQIELLSKIARRGFHLKDVPTGELSHYVLALTATCQNPRNFYGHNLLEAIDRALFHFPTAEFNNFYQFSQGVLAICGAGAPVKPRLIKDLAKGQQADGGYPFGVDATAMSILALSCAEKQRIHKHDKDEIKRVFGKAVNYLRIQQRPDGSFGNQHNTGLAVQAMIAANLEPATWRCPDALTTLTRTQHQDGSFGQFFQTTVQVLPALAGKTYADVNRIMCEMAPIMDEDEESFLMTEYDLYDPEEEPNHYVSNMTVQYTIHSDFHPNVSASIEITVPSNTSFIDIMDLAAERDERFRYEAPDTKWGHYVSAIGEVTEDHNEKRYWTIMLDPDISIDEGIDHFIPDDGDHVIFRYRKYD
ncbi:cobalamin binding intrinsic factor-like isoform X1 [Branchiostoma floridae x Branchiostoma japonicum]